jgi:hypothetical protein
MNCKNNQCNNLSQVILQKPVNEIKDFILIQI